ncbi:uncharacterized protein LOC110185730 [Drosophila serrata]|uniref:uncharacterized protein LOC110185730 n=1 Tax=Drosophila serrata TaxID=7274 RepID=UPI000A1D2016|nr:uncharacterized protein LOC110185730 [Drosophila serrata]
MSRVLIIIVLSLSILNISNCNGTDDRHMCSHTVAVTYTEEVPKKLEEFGIFEKYFKELGIPGGNKIVTKTRLEEKLVCCPGYIKSDDGDCVQLQTTTQSTTEESQTYTELPGFTSVMDQLSHGSTQENDGGYLPYILYALLAVGILIIIGSPVCFIKNRKQKIGIIEFERVIFNAEMQKALI